MKYISYLRVSTKRQGQSGLGLEAQRSAVAKYAEGSQIIAEYCEVESGKREDRVELAKALEHARATNAVVIAARLDRVGRRASHVLSLIDKSGVKVVFADAPQASDLEMGLRAIIAQEEGRAISERTRRALAAARDRGVQLGAKPGESPLSAYLAKHGNVAGCEGARRAADDFAQRLRFAIRGAIEAGAISTAGIADHLNRHGFETRRGGRWHRGQVARLLDRLGIDPKATAATAEPSAYRKAAA